jgi:hypothetical protein
MPQGAVLSSTLFSMYIYDISGNGSKNKIYSLLFADDLDKKNPNAASTHINKHLINIQK